MYSTDFAARYFTSGSPFRMYAKRKGKQPLCTSHVFGHCISASVWKAVATWVCSSGFWLRARWTSEARPPCFASG